jgi:hypothetical protein
MELVTYFDMHRFAVYAVREQRPDVSAGCLPVVCPRCKRDWELDGDFIAGFTDERGRFYATCAACAAEVAGVR